MVSGREFKSAPELFKQMYVIRAKLDNGAVSCIYAFLPGKDSRHYRELFAVVQREIQQLGIPFNLDTVTVDFEPGAYGALRSIFGQNLNVNGCFFHLTQSTFRKATEFGLRQYIVEESDDFNPDIRMFVAMVDALAFVPIQDLQIAVNALHNNVPDPMVLPLLDYFLSTYVNGRPVPNANPPRRSPPLFPPAIWSVFNVTIQGGDRTNNICEGFNHSFNAMVGQRPPPFYVALEAIQRDFVLSKRKLLQSQAGTPVVQRVRHDVQMYDRNVTRLCDQYLRNVWQGNMYEYLRRLSFNIRFK